LFRLGLRFSRQFDRRNDVGAREPTPPLARLGRRWPGEITIGGAGVSANDTPRPTKKIDVEAPGSDCGGGTLTFKANAVWPNGVATTTGGAPAIGAAAAATTTIGSNASQTPPERRSRSGPRSRRTRPRSDPSDAASATPGAVNAATCDRAVT